MQITSWLEGQRSFLDQDVFLRKKEKRNSLRLRLTKHILREYTCIQPYESIGIYNPEVVLC